MICDGCGTRMTLIERIGADIGTLMTLIERIGTDGFSDLFCIAPGMPYFHCIQFLVGAVGYSYSSRLLRFNKGK
jgi:hypothetical protein